MKPTVLRAVAVVLAVSAMGAGVYKWVDEEGRTIYSDAPRSGKAAKELELAPQPPQEQLERAQQQLNRQREKRQHSERSLALKDLGPLPRNSSSRYLETKGTNILMNVAERSAKFGISLKTKPDLPPEAYLEAHFDNPGDSDAPLVVGKTTGLGQHELVIISPEFKGLKCWNYQALIFVYKDRSKSHRLGIHLQTIQSRVNLEKLELDSPKDFARFPKGACP